MNLDPFADPFNAGLGFSSASDIFSLRRKFVGGHRPRKPEPAPEPEEELIEDAPPEEESPKVVLKNPRWEAEEVGFNEETPVSVEVVLPESHKNRKKVLFELYAHTPKDPERISQAEGFEDAGKAVARIPVYQPGYRDEEGNLLAKVDYYFTAKHSLSDLLKDDKAVKTVEHMAQVMLEAHILEDLTFATDSSRVKPSQALKLEALCACIKDWKARHAEGKLAVFGHADAVGKEEHNKTLSERRARAVHAFLAKDAKAWEAQCAEEKWGLKPIQELLKHLGHDPGPLDGKEGDGTRSALKAFQQAKGLPESGKNDAATREALFLAFMEKHITLSLAEKDFDAIDGQPSAGCSEFNRVEAKDGASEANRRVAVFLLRTNKHFPIQYPCKHGDVAACRRQVEKKGERRTPGFGCHFYDRLMQEQKGAGTGAVPGKVKLVGIDKAEIRQYVNLDPEDGKPERGMDRLFEVEAEGLEDGAEVYWVVTAGKDNSKRTDPKTGPRLAPEEEPKPFQDGAAALVSTVSGGKSSILLACGVCGGDEFTVEAGASKDKVDCKVKVVTWRRLEYETIHPKAIGDDRLTDYTFFTPDRKPGLAPKTRAYLDKALGRAFVEFEEVHKACFLREDIPEDGKHNVLDGSYIGRDRGKKFLVATYDQLSNALVFHGKHSANKRSVSIMWCDYMAEPKVWRQKFTEFSREDFRTPRLGVFERAIDSGGGVGHGDLTITSLKWAVTHWYDPSAPEASRWKPVDSPGDPGYAWRNGGTFTDEEDIKAHVRFDGIRKVAILFPDTKAGYPGKLLQRDGDRKFVDKGKVLRLSVDVTGVAYSYNFNGMALQGKIWMNTYAGQVDPVGLGVVLAHELGHNMGQGYGDKAVEEIRGRAPENAIPGIPFPKPVPEGDKYGGRGHQGIHCAKGVKDKAAPDYTAKESNAFAEHECVMFGASDMKDSKEFAFCDECTTFIRGERLTDIRKSWRN